MEQTHFLGCKQHHLVCFLPNFHGQYNNLDKPKTLLIGSFDSLTHFPSRNSWLPDGKVVILHVCKWEKHVRWHFSFKFGMRTNAEYILWSLDIFLLYLNFPCING